MRRIELFVVIAVLMVSSLPMVHAFSPPMPGLAPAPSTRNAVIISSLEDFLPMRKQDVASLTDSLTQAGYTVTFLKDGNVTLDFMVTQLNNYQVIIWRTNAYQNGNTHSDYWYIGQQYNQGMGQTYASDFASGSLDNSNGIVGAGVQFFINHFTPNMLSNVKLMIILASMGTEIAPSFINAGVKAIIDYSGLIDYQFNWVDYLNAFVVEALSSGLSVSDAIYQVYSPFLTMILHDQLDSMNNPPVSYTGDGSVTIV